MKDRFARGFAAFLVLMIAVCAGALASLTSCEPASPPLDMAADLGADQLPVSSEPADLARVDHPREPELDLAEPAGPACWACNYEPKDCGGIPSLCALQPSGQRCCLSVRPLVCGTVLR